MFRSTAILTAFIGFGLAAQASAEPLFSQATDFSSQKKVQPPKKAIVPLRTTGAPIQRNTTVNRPVNRNANINRSNVNANPNFRRAGPPGAPRAGGPGTPKTFSSPVVSRPNAGAAVGFRRGPGRIGPAFVRPANFQSVRLGNRIAPVWRGGPRRIWSRGGWRTFVPFAALGAVAIGGAYYYADAYVSVARPYCTGVTPDGCRLNWQQVDFDGGGGGEWQCVQFCPRPDAGGPPPRAVALVAPPPMAPGACEISIFSEPDFGGTNASATDEQPALGQIGWQDQIASVQVKSGTWDLFSEQQFSGETMRLPPGEYRDLGPEWTKKAGSFMCVQP